MEYLSSFFLVLVTNQRFSEKHSKKRKTTVCDLPSVYSTVANFFSTLRIEKEKGYARESVRMGEGSK
jgi:hypothetical protein